jgi:hypothetical protein
VSPTPVRLTRRALEGGAGSTLECLFCEYTGPRRDVRPAGSFIPVAVNPVRPSLLVLHHAGHCCDIPTLLGRAGTRRRHDYHCAAYGPPLTAPSNQATAMAGRSTTTPPPSKPLLYEHRTRHDWSRIRQDGHQFRGTARHASTRREIVWHTCKLLPPWPIKGGAVPQSQGTRDDGQRSPTRSPPSPRYWHLPHQYLWDLEARLPLPPHL